MDDDDLAGAAAAAAAADVPWGKYTYTLEGLATGCYLEGAADVDVASRPGAPSGRRLRFRIELPARCFVLSVALKLPNAPVAALEALNDVIIERTLSNAEYELVHDGVLTKSREERKKESAEEKKKAKEQANGDGDAQNTESVESAESGADDSSADKKRNTDGESPVSIDVAANTTLSAPPAPPPARKRVMEVRRAADSLRITLADIDADADSTRKRRGAGSGDESDDATANDMRMLGVVVVGYVRGQTPAANRIKILLNSSTRTGFLNSLADRAEVDGLLGLAFLGNRRYRQAAELLHRASNLTRQTAAEDAKNGFLVDEELDWAAELNLLAAHSYFEHMPMANDGISSLMSVASVSSTSSSTSSSPRDVQKLSSQFLDLRTELLSMLNNLMSQLVRFLGESKSLAVRMASARMIEFISEQLGCAIAPHMGGILNQVLRSYPGCTSFGARERAAAASFSYDSMEDCYERLVDICCRLLPLTEHSVLQRLFDNTLVPVFQDGFMESHYILLDMDAEEEADELMTTAVAQTLRVMYLVLNVLGADARVPPSLISRLLNIIITEKGNPCTPMLLRRSALHTWDSVCRALTQAASGVSIIMFEPYLVAQKDYLPKLIVSFKRPDFEYGESEENPDMEINVFKQDSLAPADNEVLRDVLSKREKRLEIVDRHTLGRLLTLIAETCAVLEPCKDGEERHTSVYVIMDLQRAIGCYVADLFMSSLVDVCYYEAAVCGNGSPVLNNMFQYGDINRQLHVVCGVLSELFVCYWAVLSLLPSRMAIEASRSAPIRGVLGWCVERMKHTAPPRGMLRLLTVVVKGLQHELNKSMYKLSTVPTAPHEATFIMLHRAQLTWFPRASFEEAFDLADALNEAVSKDFMAQDLVTLIDALGNQSEAMQTRTDASLDLLATIVATSTPSKPDLALSSLKILGNPSLPKQRMVNGFPKSNSFTRSSGHSSFSRKLRISSNNQSREDPMSRSLYVHVVLASCFDKFDGLGRAAKRQGGPAYMGDLIDAFVEHAALSVRCLHGCARARNHREYIGAILGDIFSTCLAMQDQVDGRVRLAGFEIFAAALDVLFLAPRAMILLPPQPNVARSDSVLGAVGAPDGPTAVTELPVGPDSQTATGSNNSSGVPVGDGASSGVGSASPPPGGDSGQNGSQMQNGGATMDGNIAEQGGEQQMASIFLKGGACTFEGDNTSTSQLTFEERGWQMLCAFMTSSLGVGKYVDFVVQRACLEYLKGCMLNALRGRSSGASIIAFEHVEQIWEAVYRLVGSPWRTLNGLALWVICAALNMGIYSAVTARGRGAIRQRQSQLEEFAINQVFPTADSFLKSTTRETRLWGMRLLEVYIRARDMNSALLEMIPAPPSRILRALDNLKHDWSEDVRKIARSLLDVHFDSLNKKVNPHVQSFTAQAHSFMSLKRNNDDTSDGLGGNSSKVELWFPPLPKPTTAAEMEVFCRTLEAFANTEVQGGEEIDLLAEFEDEDDDGEYDDEEDGCYEEEEEAEGEAAVDSEIPAADGPGDDSSDILEGQGLNPSGLVTEESGKQSEELTIDTATAKDAVAVAAGDETEADGNQVPSAVDDEEFADCEDVAAISKSEGEEEDDDDDNEFTSMTGFNPTLSETNLSDDALPPPTPEETAASAEDEDSDEDVVEVTNDLDPLADVESMAQPRKPTKEQIATNPDLEIERRPALRRQGSFTNRPSASHAVSAEGEAPKLARRRSVDTGAFPAGPEGASHGNALMRRRSNMEEDDSSWIGAGIRRRSGKEPPPALPLKGDSSGDNGTEHGGHRSGGILRATQRDSAVGAAFLQLSPKGSRIQRGVMLDEDADEAVQPPPQRESRSRGGIGGADDVRRRGAAATANSSESPRFGTGSKPARRSLPRASAFIKGGPPKRTTGTGAGSGGDGGVQGTGASSSPAGGADGGASSWSGSTGSSPRPHLPRSKSAVKNFRAGAEDGDSARLDRSHRYSKREPMLSLTTADDDDELGTDILEDMDQASDFGDVLEKRPGFRVGTPKGDSATSGRNTLADDSPNSGYMKRRGSKRNVFDSLHYKSLVDQLDGTPESDGPNSGGINKHGNSSKVVSPREPTSDA